MTMRKTKTCGNCNKIFDTSEFYVQIRKYTKKDGTISEYPRLSHYCKKCDQKLSKRAKEKESYKNWEKKYKKSKEYRRREAKRRREDPIYRKRTMLYAAKQRSKKYNTEFTLTFEDIDIPKYCPILEVPLIWGTKENYEHTPSLDRIDPSKGYTKENTRVISKKANSMKNSANKKEMTTFIKNIIDYMSLNVEDIVRTTEKK